MKKIVGVRFREGGKVYDFDPGHFVLSVGDYVMVKTEKGFTVGKVVTPPRRLGDDVEYPKLKKIFRLATEDDLKQYEEMLQREKRAFAFCKERIEARGLPMNLVLVESLYDGSKITFYFTADGRVDFRELVKDLVKEFHTRIELRQVGVRNQAKMIGGIGTCGRELCCSGFLREFHPVSIKMAKEQNLSLNPSKISGACGRLMCCLKFEYESYLESKKGMPKLGKKIDTPMGRGRVIRQNIINKTITVSLDSGSEVEFTMEDLGLAPPKKKTDKSKAKSTFRES
ncbi:MAG: stage 0 sporulation protein [Deltaproteobacteria bacterium]|nr:MAG: stage 0 sporulation protein [Deltaproteobacteria bacterium]